MCKNILRNIAYAVAAMAAFLKLDVAEAAMITMEPLSPSYSIGQDPITVKIVGLGFEADALTGAIQGSLGGGLDISWDSNVLQLTGVTRKFSSANDYWVDEIPSVTTNEDSGISALLGLSVSSFSGNGAKNFDIAELSFSFAGPGVSNIVLSVSELDVWTDASGFIDVKPSVTNGTITVSGVPLPPALILFGSSLLGMVAYGRRKAVAV